MDSTTNSVQMSAAFQQLCPLTANDTETSDTTDTTDSNETMLSYIVATDAKGADDCGSQHNSIPVHRPSLNMDEEARLKDVIKGESSTSHNVAILKNAVICLPVSKKNRALVDQINHYLKLIRLLGGQSRKDMKSGKSFERTHLIETRTDTENYRCAVIYGIPILFGSWIDEVWDRRNEPNFNPNDPDLLAKHKVKAFYNLFIAFVGFSEDQPKQAKEKMDFEAATQEHGGHVVEPTDERCTHFVVNATKDTTIAYNYDSYPNLPDYIVYKSWFIASLEIKNRENEENHQIVCAKRRSPSRTPSNARPSTVSLGVLSPEYDNSFVESVVVSKTDLNATDWKLQSKIYHIFDELYQTETNYVNNLKAILQYFRDPLKDHQKEGDLPNEIELKTIFGCLPPIVELHEKVLAELTAIHNHFSEDNDTGRIFVEHSQEFLKVYPEYMNFLEDIKQTIDNCMDKYPQFVSFIQVAQKNCSKEIGRQTLKDLMTLPFQRPMKYPMILERLLKATDKSKSDYEMLERAHNNMVEVNKRINKGKEDVQGQMKMFDFLKEIENCPPTLLSAQRHYISECDVKLLYRIEETKEVVALENYEFRLYLFSDNILLCKKRTLKRSNSLSVKEPNYNNSSGVKKNSSKKCFKWVDTIELDLIKAIRIQNSQEFANTFAIVTHPKENEATFRIYPFLVKVPEFSRDKILSKIDTAVKGYLGGHVNIIDPGDFKSLDFRYANTLVADITKSKFRFGSISIPKRLGITRSTSVRRKTLMPGVSTESLHVLSNEKPPSSPSTSRRISRTLSSFLSPNFLGLPHRSSHRYLQTMGSMTSLNENFDTNNSPNNFSLPTTPAPRKKKCPTNDEQTMQT